MSTVTYSTTAVESSLLENGKKFDSCSGTCENGGTWNTDICACNCLSGYYGILCTSQCSTLCNNGAVVNESNCECICNEKQTGTKCDCIYPFTGGYCDTCAFVTCENGGIFNATSCSCACLDGSGDPQCKVDQSTTAVSSTITPNGSNSGDSGMIMIIAVIGVAVIILIFFIGSWYIVFTFCKKKKYCVVSNKCCVYSKISCMVSNRCTDKTVFTKNSSSEIITKC
ncbi:uncharacterized protein LOC143069860 [Mytilus galloprovincialis]|uniref:uncharacterized protein LOC143069860 n=1 Tax=Mytilus galloprovincialis TaxID=29158 RepID=UPI003F7CCAD2